MNRVLFLSYFFPPNPTIGAQRPYRLAKYFPEFGWEPIVLTTKLPVRPPYGIRIIETEDQDILSSVKSKIGFSPEKGLHQQLGITETKNFNYSTWKSQIIKLVKEIIAYPDDQKGWYQYAMKSASKFLSEEKVDAIISTSSPVTSHLVARKLKQKFKIPWIADLRDLWTQNHFYNKFDVIKYFERRLELKTLNDADVLVTVTKGFADELKTLHKYKKIFFLTNGYDPDDYLDKKSELTSKFSITYTGKLYNGKMDPSLLFEVISSLIDENRINRDFIEIRFFGPEESWLINDIKKYNLERVVNYYGFLPREEILKKQRESHLLLLLLDTNNKEVTYYPAKVFEYFAARRPIIAIGCKGENIRAMLKESNAGVFTESANDLKTILLKHYKEFLDSGDVRYHGNDNIKNYRYDLIAKRYSEILNEILYNVI